LEHFFALSLSAGLAIETADLEQAERDLDDAFAIAAQVDVPVLEYNTRCVRVWRAGLAGDLAEAERLAHSAMRFGIAKGVEYAVVGPSLQIGGMRWQQGRIAEVLPILRMQWLAGDPNAAVLLARALADADETRAEAAEVLERAAGHDFADLPLGVHWSATLVAAAQASFMLGNGRVGRLVFEHLEPFAEYLAFNGSWVFAPLGLAAGLGAAVGGVDAAVVDQLFEQAISVSERVRAPMLRIHAEMGWSHALQARGAFAEKAKSLADAARRRCADLRIDLPSGALY
jgi:hypothetical protein